MTIKPTRFKKSVVLGHAMMGIPAHILQDIQAIGAMTMSDEAGRIEWYPGLVLQLNGEHPVRVLSEITRAQWAERVRASDVMPEWLDCPAGTRFWLVSFD